MRRLLILLMLMGCAACQPWQDAPRLMITPFPTMTPGRIAAGDLPEPETIGGLVSPATAVAIARQPTATPDFGSCASLTNVDVILEQTPPSNPRIVIEEIVRYLAAGGDLDALHATLRDAWAIFGEAGFLRADLDLTGEGVPEVIIGYLPTDGRGTLIILGCAEGLYQLLYETESDTAQIPEIVILGDLNRSGSNHVLFAAARCERDANGQIIDFENCGYRTQLIAWQPDHRRFVNLMPDDVVSDMLPSVTDFDNDEVSEIVIRQESNGNRVTGPVRTGVKIYDWDGSSYLLSIVQLNPPRYHIQILHEADRLFMRRNWANAIPLYQVVSGGESSLRYWFDNEPDILRSYALYKLLVAQIAASDIGLPQTQQQINSLYPDVTLAPVYIELAQTFLNAFQLNGDVHSACEQIHAIIDAKPDALELLNRYGTRNPRYTATDLCPF